MLHELQGAQVAVSAPDVHMVCDVSAGDVGVHEELVEDVGNDVCAFAGGNGVTVVEGRVAQGEGEVRVVFLSAICY